MLVEVWQWLLPVSKSVSIDRNLIEFLLLMALDIGDETLLLFFFQLFMDLFLFGRLD